MSWVDAQRAAQAAEDIAQMVFGARMPIAKRKETDPLTREGFAAIIRSLAGDMLAQVTGPEEKAIRAVIAALDVDWPKLSPAKRDAAIARAMGALAGVPRIVAPKIGDVLKAAGADVVLGTKKASKNAYALRIDPTYEAVDMVVVAHAASSQAFYIRNEYGRREDGFAAIARDVVSKGVEQGLDRYEIGRELKKTLEGTSADRSDAYFRMVASVFATRSRTYATARGFEEAGIQLSEWSSVVDEVTSDICRFMDGKIIAVSSMLERFEQVASSPDPEAVKELQPFVGRSRDEEGDYLYYRQGEQRVQVARIEESGFGKRDERGAYSKAIDQAGIEKAGITPPAHGHCRSLLVPAGSTGSSVPVPPAMPPPPAIAVGPSAPPPAARPPTEPTVSPGMPTGPAPSPAPPRPAEPPPPTKSPGTGRPKKQPEVPDTPTEGVHFERLLSIIDPYEASALLDSMEQGVLRFLRAKPISGLFFVDAIAGSPAYGRLSWRTDPATMAKYGFILQVSGGRPIQSYGDAMVPGSSWSMSSAGATKQAAMERTFTHELGHHVHLNGGKQVDTLVRRAYRLTMKENRAITLYAMTNPLEYFAETFTAYRYEPTLLKARDPRGYRMVRRIRKLTGVDQ